MFITLIAKLPSMKWKIPKWLQVLHKGILSGFIMLSFKLTKIESILFVPIILTFSKNLRCLNLALTQAQKSVTRHFWWLKKLCIFFILALSKNFWSFLEFFCWQHCSHTGKFKHLKFLENVKIIGTNNIDSILEVYRRPMILKIRLLLWLRKVLSL